MFISILRQCIESNPSKIYNLTRSIRDSETSIDFVQGPPGSRRERVKEGGIYFTISNVYLNKNTVTPQTKQKTKQ